MFQKSEICLKIQYFFTKIWIFSNVYCSKEYLSKVYFCGMHLTCVSSKLCEFIKAFDWFLYWLLAADEDDLDTGPVVLNVIEVPPKIANLRFQTLILIYSWTSLITFFLSWNIPKQHSINPHLSHSSIVWLNSVMALQYKMVVHMKLKILISPVNTQKNNHLLKLVQYLACEIYYLVQRQKKFTR